MLVHWKREPDGEYNEHVATITGRTVRIFSDRDGERWSMQIENEDIFDLDATYLNGAKTEAASRAEG